MQAYVQLVLPVSVEKNVAMRKHKVLGIRETTTRNFANSREDQALSRYLPPCRRVNVAAVRVRMLLSTRLVVTKVHGYMRECAGTSVSQGTTTEALDVR